jgi:hypothetical protein
LTAINVIAGKHRVSSVALVYVGIAQTSRLRSPAARCGASLAALAASAARRIAKAAPYLAKYEILLNHVLPNYDVISPLDAGCVKTPSMI